ncbi:MAG TPA: hypothetical protein VFR81_18875 [Longimicrobium sp.]|nr:hypothetical protein [Longimicrobium sp.]
MKRAAILLASLAVLGCEQSPNPVFEQLSVEQAPRSESFRGTVVLYRLPGSSDVVAAVDEASDGRADVAFVLQRGFAPGGPGFTRLGGGRIEADDAGVRVMDAAGRRVAALYLASRFPESASGAGIRGVVLDRVWTGYGIARRTGGWEMPASAGSEAAAALGRCSRGASLSLASFGTAPACSSGGAGSTSCSMSCPGGGDCSVTCDKGYYSCCDKVWCTCTCNPKEIVYNPQG